MSCDIFSVQRRYKLETYLSDGSRMCACPSQYSFDQESDISFMRLFLIQESGKSVLKVWFQFSIRASFIIMPLRYHYWELPLSLCSPSENTHSQLADPEDQSAEARARLATIINGWENLSSVCSFWYLTFQRPIAGHSENSPWLDGYHVYKSLFRKTYQVPGC